MQLRRSVLFAALASAALALSACGQSPTAGDNPPVPPDVAANFSQPIDAKAPDGSWTLKIRDNQITLSRYTQPDLIVTAPGAMIEPHQATWMAKTPDNRTVTVKIYASTCVYPATIEEHTFSAEVDLPGSSPLSGCGDPAGGAKPVAAKTAAAKTAGKP